MARPLTTTLILFSVLSVLAIPAAAAVETIAGLPLHVQTFDSGAVRVWIGDHVSSTATVAIPTAKGVVIVDTTGNPEVDRQLRAAIAERLGRDDFVALINTHEHDDHTGGNAVYADCEIIGHSLVAEGMRRTVAGRERIVEWRTQRAAQLETELASMADDDPARGRTQESLILKRIELATAASEPTPAPPTRTFDDRLVLDYGDVVFELYYIGGMHSSSDIAILVPEHGLLLTGDTMADVWLTDTPGCLASFTARPGVTHDFPRLLKNWNHLLERADEIDHYLPGHWNGELSHEGFAARVAYVEEMWEGVERIVAERRTLTDMLADYRLETRFPDLVDSPGCNQGNTSTTLLEMWSEQTGQQSAARVMYVMLDEGRDAAAVKAVVDQHDAAEPEHYFIEGQINALGYRLLQTERPAEACVMFAAYVEVFPESWNAYDSYGEALLATGEADEAVAMYEKSLQLNPENENGRTMLQRIRGGAAED